LKDIFYGGLSQKEEKQVNENLRAFNKIKIFVLYFSLVRTLLSYNQQIQQSMLLCQNNLLVLTEEYDA
jgi:hypothetical protein